MVEPDDAEMRSGTVGARRPPDIIQVIPPFETFTALMRSEHTGIAMSVATGLAFLLFLIFWRTARDSLESMGMLFLAILGCLIAGAIAIMFRIGLSRLRRRALLRYERAFGVLSHSCPPNPVGATIWKRWNAFKRVPTALDVKEALNEHRGNDRCQVIILGKARIPPVGHLFFEPVIIRPTERTKPEMRGVLGALANLLILWLIARFMALPVGRSLMYVAIMVLSIHCALYGMGLYRRRDHLRIMPGLIQFIRFPLLRGSKPSVRSYPMIAGTTVVAVGQWSFASFRSKRIVGRSRTRLWWIRKLASLAMDPKRLRRRRALISEFYLFRDGLIDEVRCWSPQIKSDGEELRQAMWNAILTTARIPEISATELLG